mmetsp:Transcript_97377/g.297511  ORF Transcript_97377/g.297511 Transcript_97377/m.297511 type:complete len:268 (-) Transcript_97377:497-1300(-)
MNSMPLTSPSTMTRSSTSGAWPTNLKFLPNKPDQKNGVVVKGTYCPSMFFAATRPCCVATSQCSILTREPVRREGYAHTSPAAYKLGTASALSKGPTQMAPFLSRDTPSMNLVFGSTPAPMTTPSAGRTSPSSSSTPLTRLLPRNSRTCALPYHSTPSFCSTRAKEAPTFLPKTRSKGTVSIATTETSQPFFFSAEAISIPMKDPPTTTIRWPFFACREISAASSGVRRVITPARFAPGQNNLRGDPPVATRAASYLSVASAPSAVV